MKRQKRGGKDKWLIVNMNRCRPSYSIKWENTFKKKRGRIMAFLYM
jgi:hypothetical protein